MDARDLLTVAALIGAGGLLAGIGWWASRYEKAHPNRRRGGSRTSGVLGTFDEIFHPAAYEAQQLLQAQTELPAPSPIPGGAPDLAGGRISLIVPGGTDILVSAALIFDADGRMLVVRKHGTSVFMNPGGKPEADETPAETLTRELAEELSINVPVDSLDYLGRFSAAAANEAGHTVVAEVFRVPDTGLSPRATAEIAELRWVSLAEVAALGEAIAPLIHQHFMRFLR